MPSMPHREPEQKGLGDSKDSMIKGHKPNELVPRLKHVPVHKTGAELLPREDKPPQPRGSK